MAQGSRYAIMWSGGKDSALALWRARQAGLQVASLLTFYDGDTGRIRFHATRIELLVAQATRLNLALRSVGTSWQAFDASFRAALAELASQGVAGIVFGDIHLADVRAWYEERVRAAGLEHVEPLWGGEPAALLTEFVASGARAVITCCELAKLDERWLGRVIDEGFLQDIASTGVDPCGENGEYHSFTFAGPLFSTPVPWHLGERRRENGFAQVDLLP